MTCPNCGLINPELAGRCDCGYDFEARQVRKEFIPAPRPPGWFRRSRSGRWKFTAGFLWIVLIVVLFVASVKPILIFVGLMAWGGSQTGPATVNKLINLWLWLLLGLVFGGLGFILSRPDKPTL